jgi:pilus assembly protein CpaB
MTRRLLTVLLSAFIIAAGCSYFVYRLVGARLATNVPKGTRVIAAAADIKIGTILKAADLTTTEVFGPVPKGVFSKPEDVLGRGVVSDIYQGEPVMDSRLAPAGSGGGLAATIRPGMRACAIKVDDVVGVAGFVTPGSHVDVLISGVPPGAANQDQGTKVKTLLQNIEVLSAGQDIQKDAEGKPKTVQVVNLLVTPDDAEALSLASNQAKVQLVLRNPLDTELSKTSGIAMSRLYADSNPAPKPTRAAVVHVQAAPAAPAPFVVEVMNGSKRTEEKFGPSEKKQ